MNSIPDAPTPLDEKYEKILEFCIEQMQQHISKKIAELADPQLVIYNYYQLLKSEHTRENVIKNYKNTEGAQLTPLERAEYVLLSTHAQAEIIYMLANKKSTQKQYGRTCIEPVFGLTTTDLVAFN